MCCLQEKYLEQEGTEQFNIKDILHNQQPKTSGVATIKVDFEAMIIITDGDILIVWVFKDQLTRKIHQV